MIKMRSEVLLQSERGSLIDREHAGFIVLVDKQGKVLKEIGKSFEYPFYLRSCAKPFQALASLNLGTLKAFDLNLKHLAIACASHSGTKEHVFLVQDILNKAGLNEMHLNCGAHPPLDKDSREELIRENKSYTSLHNNCSGKHALMLATCRHKNWDLESYLYLDHKLQVEILKLQQKYMNIKKPLHTTIDGCGTPIWAAPLKDIALGLLKLFLSEEGQILAETYKNHPNLIGGRDRQDSEIIKASGCELIAKVGAEGLIVVINPELKQSLIVKIQDSNMQARAIVTLECLNQLGWIKEEKVNSEIFDPLIKTYSGSFVGSLKTTFKF